MRGIRLDDACVNTQLTSLARTARLANVTDERIAELVDSSLGALEAILRWNRSPGDPGLSADVEPDSVRVASGERGPWWEVVGR